MLTPPRRDNKNVTIPHNCVILSTITDNDNKPRLKDFKRNSCIVHMSSKWQCKGVNKVLFKMKNKPKKPTTCTKICGTTPTANIGK